MLYVRYLFASLFTHHSFVVVPCPLSPVACVVGSCIRVTGLYSACLGDNTLSATSGDLLAAGQAIDALNDANPNTARFVTELDPPYDHSSCVAAGADVGDKPYEFAVFCNGDGTVPVSGVGLFVVWFFVCSLAMR